MNNGVIRAAFCILSEEPGIIVGDFNGDGKTDFASWIYDPSTTSYVGEMFASTGDGHFTWLGGSSRYPVLPPLCPIAGKGDRDCISLLPNHLIVGDFNGDGRTDFMSANTNFDTFVSMGDGSVREIGSSPPPAGCSTAEQCINQNRNGVLVGDFNGDGLVDFLSKSVGLTQGQPADHMIRTSNGTGGSTAIAYAPSSNYTNTYLPVGAVFQTVQSTIVNDSNGVSDSHTFSYRGGLWDPEQRQFLGFKTITETIDGAGDYRATNYLQSPLCLSIPTESYVKDAAGKVYSINSVGYSDPGSIPPYRCLAVSHRDYQAEKT